MCGLARHIIIHVYGLQDCSQTKHADREKTGLNPNQINETRVRPEMQYTRCISVLVLRELVVSLLCFILKVHVKTC